MFRICLVAFAAFFLLAGASGTAHSTKPIQTSKTSTTLTANNPYDVRIVFTGMMVTVPEPNGVTMIVPSVKKKIDEIGDDGHDVHAHMAYILSTLDQMPADHETNEDHQFLATKAMPEKYHYLPLAGELITIDEENDVAVLNPNPLDYLNTNVNKPCPTTVDEARDLYWLSSIKRVHGSGTFDPEDKFFDKRPKKKNVAARALVRHGKLDARVIKPGYIWDFRTPVKSGSPGPIKHTQATAEEVHWTFKARGLPFILNLRDFKGNLREVAFMPDANKQITIVIGHTKPEETGPVAASKEARDNHYSVYHLFKKQDPGKGPIPHEPKRGAALECAATYPAQLHDSIWKMLEPKMTFTITAKGRTVSVGPSPSALNCAPSQWP
jgi:hypothetical protein